MKKIMKDKIKQKLSEGEIIQDSTLGAPRFGWDNPVYQPLMDPIVHVMSAYQNANKWLDTMKEHILITLKCPYFSNIVHQLAHTMPGRFDRFGDILHTENLEIPYPATAEWSQALGNPANCINIICDILQGIQIALVEFKKAAETAGLPAMSISCDPLLTEISDIFVFYHRASDMLDIQPDLNIWDKHVYAYYEEQSKLI